MAATRTAKSAVWVTTLFGELGYNSCPRIQIDNLSTIKLARDDQFHKRSKHIYIQ